MKKELYKRSLKKLVISLITYLQSILEPVTLHKCVSKQENQQHLAYHENELLQFFCCQLTSSYQSILQKKDAQSI